MAQILQIRILIGFEYHRRHHTRMRYPRPMLVAMALTLGGCIIHPPDILQPPKETTLAADRVELPTVFVNGCPFVELKVNGKGPYRFLVDTGAELTSVTPLVAREARLSSFPGYVAKLMGANGQVEPEPIVTIDRLEAPHLTLRLMSGCILSPESARIVSVNDFGGILGMRLLQNVVLEIDFPQHKVSLARPGSVKYPAENSIPFTEYTPHVTITTPAVKYSTTVATIDTGGDGGFEFADVVSYPVRTGLIKIDGFVAGVGGYWRPLQGQLNGDIILGPATWRNPVISSAMNNRIGSEALAPWKLVIDPTKKMLWLLNGAVTVATEWTGPLDSDGRRPVYGFGFYPDGDAYIIKEVDSGSRAERAGFKAGDRILLDGAPGEKTGPSLDYNRLETRFKVVRGSEQLEIAISFRDLLPVPDHPAATTP